ncbi:MAG: Gmad2 immunoglobulin-like domain-containing protein [Candidatus Moranbacteria bacterium]|jgi:hypothetical protein|nr:Gmad2 immunoglobulin-like domain-containing protein [Candidatus Moranbacteria bacterium]
MELKKIATWIVVIAVILIGIWLIKRSNDATPPVVNSFEDCEKAGYPVMESYPRQCATPDGRTFAEELTSPITYVNASVADIRIELPTPGAVVGKEFKVMGEARAWYFEGSFPIEILDANGARLVAVPAQAQDEWMTAEFVAFEADITIPADYMGPATIVLHKDNPSDMRELDASASFPITVEY